MWNVHRAPKPRPKYEVDVEIRRTITVYANSEDQAEDKIYKAINTLCPHDEISILDVNEA